MTAKTTVSPHFNISIQMDYKTIIALIQQLEKEERKKVWQFLGNEFSKNKSKEIVGNSYKECTPPKVTLELMKKWEKEWEENPEEEVEMTEEEMDKAIRNI